MTDYITIARNLTPSGNAHPSVPNAIGQLKDQLDAVVAGDVEAAIYGAIDTTFAANKTLGPSEGKLQVLKATNTGLTVTLPAANDAAMIAGQPWLIVNPAAVDEQQNLTFTGGPTGGTIKLTFDAQETAAISYSAVGATMAANIAAALNALSNLGGVGCEPVSATLYRVTFGGVDGSAEQNLLTLSNNSLTGGTTPSLTIAEHRAGFAAGESYDIADNGGRLLVTGLAPGEQAVLRLLDGASAAGSWYAGSAPIGSRVSQVQSEDTTLTINGGMSVDARGAASGLALANDTYYVDRWRARVVNTAAAATVYRSTEVPAGAGFGHSLRVDVTTADASVAAADAVGIGQRIEARALQHLRFGTSSARSLAVGFWVRGTITGANHVTLYQPDADRSYIAQYNIDAADTWEFKTLVVPGDVAGQIDNDSGNGLELIFALMAGTDEHGTPGLWQSGLKTASSAQVNQLSSAANDFYLTGVDLKVGDKATPFVHRHPAIEELLCSWYYERLRTAAGGRYKDGGQCVSATGANFVLGYRPKRATPSVAMSAATYFQVTGSSGTTIDVTGISTNQVDARTVELNVTVASGLSAGNVTHLRDDSGANSYIELDAEL